MKFNPITSRFNSTEKVEVTEYEFWVYALNFFNATYSYGLTNKGIKVLATVLSLDLYKSYFSVPESKELQNRVDNLSGPELTHVKKRLLESGLLVEGVDENDKRRKPTLPNPVLRQMQKYIKEHKSLEFHFPFIIKSNDKRTGVEEVVSGQSDGDL